MSNAAPPADPLTVPEPWNAVAAGYDETLFSLWLGLHEDAIRILQPSPSSVLLDVATGPGTFAIRVAPRVARVVAVDFAENMIERLRARAREAGVENVDARVMNGEALELLDASFDAAVSMFGWFMFADRARGLSEMHRVLKPSGRVLVTSWSTADRNTLLGNGMDALRAALPELPRPAKPPATQSPETCATEMRAAGFFDVTTTLSTHPVSFPSADDYWDMLERSGAPLVVLRKKLGEEAWQAAKARAAAFLRERFGSGPVELQTEAIVTSGIREE